MTLADELRANYNPRVAEALAAATRAAPFPSLLGFEVVEQRPGYIACKLAVADRHLNGVGLLHGGALTALIDHVLSLVVYPHVEVGKWVATLDLKVSYLAPVREGEILAEAQIVSLRRRIGTVRIDVKNARGGEPELVAAAMGTVYVKDPPGR
jgi:uncharacterized protein (TIGR00369 family)